MSGDQLEPGKPGGRHITVWVFPPVGGMTAAARDSFPSLFVGSKLPQLITDTAGEKDHLSYLALLS